MPGDIDAGNATVLGDFNEWDPTANPMRRLKDGTFSASLSLEIGRRYAFRYLLDGERWENAPVADAYEPNPFGTSNSVIEV